MWTTALFDDAMPDAASARNRSASVRLPAERAPAVKKPRRGTPSQKECFLSRMASMASTYPDSLDHSIPAVYNQDLTVVMYQCQCSAYVIRTRSGDRCEIMKPQRS